MIVTLAERPHAAKNMFQLFHLLIHLSDERTDTHPGFSDSVGSTHRVWAQEIRVMGWNITYFSYDIHLSAHLQPKSSGWCRFSHFQISDQISFAFALIFGGFQMPEVEKCKGEEHLSAFEKPKRSRLSWRSTLIPTIEIYKGTPSY